MSNKVYEDGFYLAVLYGEIQPVEYVNGKWWAIGLEPCIEDTLIVISRISVDFGVVNGDSNV